MQDPLLIVVDFMSNKCYLINFLINLSCSNDKLTSRGIMKRGIVASMYAAANPELNCQPKANDFCLFIFNTITNRILSIYL